MKNASEAASGRPSETELADAPTLTGWMLEQPSDSNPWLYGWFISHPEIVDGDHGHTSPLVEMDRSDPPTWARTENRVFKLGAWYPPAEREIRYWCQKLRQRDRLPFEGMPGGGDNIEEMIEFIREKRPFREQKLARMISAYREEQVRAVRAVDG